MARDGPGLCRFDLPDGTSLACIDLRALLAHRARPLPACLKIVLENVARQVLRGQAPPALMQRIADWTPAAGRLAVPLSVSRLIVPDSSGLPLLMDLAASRDAAAARGADPARMDAMVPITLVVDHSLIVDVAGHPNAEARNIAAEYRRNAERYSFFKWAEQAFAGLRVVPPGAGIIHQVHLEHLARLVDCVDLPGHGRLAAPEFVLGCDSHTPMAGGMGLLAWGVGGIEGEAAALGQRHVAHIPRVVGVRLTGRLPAGATTTDLVLTITERLRQVGVTGDFVEFFGPGLADLSVPDRATIANMAPEYGATLGYFPIDAQTIAYLHQTGRDADHVALVEAHARAAGLYVEDHGGADHGDAEHGGADHGGADHGRTADYTRIVEMDLTETAPSLAGPKRPQDRVPLTQIKPAFRAALTAPAGPRGFGLTQARADRTIPPDGTTPPLRHGRILLAAITSCTNTSNPGVMIAAGLLARNAVARGLTVPGWVKTSLAPGSRLVGDYLRRAGLMAPLETLGFHIVGHACTTCSGKSGPIAPDLERAVTEHDLVGVAVLSGNRNFEGRIHPACRAAYLAAPPLVVAFALAGRIDIDVDTEPLGHAPDGTPVLLRDIWPDPDETAALIRDSQQPGAFRAGYATLFDGADLWRDLPAPSGARFDWDPRSSYVCRPPFFEIDNPALPDAMPGARVLVMAGDSLSTDHITPSGAIAPDSAGGQYLIACGVAPADFNAVTQRRGNHDFMARITFANPRMQNLLVPERTGGVTRLAPDADPQPVHQAAQALRACGAPAMVLAGRDYGMGSSRDWAAKGPRLLGVRLVLAEGFERIHRANLIGMGILPLTFRPGENAEQLGLTGFETYDFENLHAAVANGAPVRITARAPDGATLHFEAGIDIAHDSERGLLKQGGMFAALLDRMGTTA